MIPDANEPDPLVSDLEEICSTARICHARGWAPATSGNFSLRHGRRIFITASGIDKSTLTPGQLLEIDQNGTVISGTGRPSAEVGLHTAIYREREQSRAILHVHSIWNTLLSGRFLNLGRVSLHGYELLKGLSGVRSHEHTEYVPIIRNSQDYESLARDLISTLRGAPDAHGVLLSRHGLYTWGESVADARRHLEALEFLFEAEGREILGQHL